MPNENSDLTESKPQHDQQNESNPEAREEVSSDDSDSGYDSDESSEDEESQSGEKNRKETEDEPLVYTRPGEEMPDSENTPEANFKRFSQVLDSKRVRRKQDEEDRAFQYDEDLFDFPKDPENWCEENLRELWADAPTKATKPGWDPVWADEEDWDIIREEIEEGRDPPIAPFYVPYRKSYPVIPEDHHDISNPKAVIEELDRIEEFLRWVSYVFQDGSSYEGTVWDDLAQGKGVYVGEDGLVRYEGEWFQNDVEGHGVVEVDIPDIEPIPGSKLEARMRAEGHIISRDFMSPEDREWLEMDVEDSMRLAGGVYEKPFYENEEWIRQFGRKPEKGRYRYAGQWKHGRMHGCGVYEVNERTIYGRFYFGELVEDSFGCDEDTSALHAGIAEVAAAKARMFVNKPDGMVREERGPYSDPQHPYFYEEEDMWMAPGFINQFYEVPEYWKTYVHEVDQEREMWLNSFYKAPLRLPMPAELEYWWSKRDDTPEFVLVNKEPEPDPEDPSKLVHKEDPLILHTPTGRVINYIDDEKHGLRLFWQPPLEEGEKPDPEKVEFLPLGFDEFFGRGTGVKKENIWVRFTSAVEKACKPVLDKLEKWSEEKIKESELNIELYTKELELLEAELCLEEAIEDMDEELKRREKEEEKKAKMDMQETEDTSILSKQDETNLEEEEDEEEEEDDDEGDAGQSSFGSVIVDQDSRKSDPKDGKPRGSPFSTSSLSFASCNIIAGVPSSLQQSFLSWKNGKSIAKVTSPSFVKEPEVSCQTINFVSFPRVCGTNGNLKSNIQHLEFQAKSFSNKRCQLHSLSRILSKSFPSGKLRRSAKEQRRRSHSWLHIAPKTELDSVLSLHTPV